MFPPREKSTPPVTPRLDHLRAEIDRIDRALLELIVERAEVVREVAAVKRDREAGRTALRPAREARVLRRLVEEAHGRIPAAVLVRMWRELIGALTRAQAPLSLAVYAPGGRAATWDLARDHFGSLTPAVRVESASQAIRAVGDESATVAVLPLPGDDDPWWPALISDHHDRLRIFARLPFVTPPLRDGEDAQALAVGRVDLEPSGDDASLLAIEGSPAVSRGRLRSLLLDAGLTAGWIAVRPSSDDAPAVHLVEVDSLVLDGDPRIGALLGGGRGEILRVVPLGGYPRALVADSPA
jgi:chorismate mutase